MHAPFFQPARTAEAKLARTLEILSELVSFDTVSSNSNLGLIDWIESYLGSYGVAAERIPDETGRKASLFTTIGPADRGGYVLSGHTDVVPVEGQSWSSDPFRLRIEGSRAYGRGACDMKGFLACCLASVPILVEQPLETPVHLAFSYDEEVGCVGVRPMLERLAAREIRPVGAFIGEPTQMQVVTGHKGKRSVRAVVRGATAHSSLAPLAVNAVQYAAQIVAHIAGMAKRLQREGARDAMFDVPHSTGHVGLIQGGQSLNIVPDRAELLFEFRTIAADDPDALVAEVKAFAEAALLPEMRAVDERAGIEFSVYAGFPGLDTAEDAPIVTLAKSLAGRNDHAKVAFGTEAGLFHAIAGIPSVVLGPGSIGEAHKADEFIEIAELARCLGLIERLAERCRA